MATRDLKLEKYEDVAGFYRWRVLAGNGKQLAKSPRGYATMAELNTDLEMILKQPHDAEVYRDKRREWRWRLILDNRNVAIASEGYVNRPDCKTASDLFLDAVPKSNGGA